MGQQEPDHQGTSFDLTFKGTILPKQNAGRVKECFGQLFNIDDSSLLEELFSGEEIILRSGLDRAAAGEYYRKITKLGSTVELTDSERRRWQPGQVITRLEDDEQGKPTLTREKVHNPGMDREININEGGEVQKSWPVSAARLKSNNDKSDTDKTVQDMSENKKARVKRTLRGIPTPDANPKQEPAELTEQLAAEEDAMQAELDRVREAARERSLQAAQKKAQGVANERAQQEAANEAAGSEAATTDLSESESTAEEKAKRDACIMLILDSTKAEISRLNKQQVRADQELKQELMRLEQLEKEVEQTMRRKLEKYKNLSIATSDRAHDEICHLRSQELDAIALGEPENERLAELSEAVHVRAQEAVAKLEQQKVQSDAVSREELRQLEDSIAELQQAPGDNASQLSELEQHKGDLELMRSHSQKQLEKDIAAVRDTERAELEELQGESDGHGNKIQQEVDQLRQAQLATMDKKNAELRRLTQLELDARQKCKDKLTALQLAADKARSKADKEIKRLQAMAREVKQREAAELRRLNAQYSA